MNSNPYIFCDIDGTLLSARHSGRSAFGDAFNVTYNVPIDMSHINFAGATDIRVLDQLLSEQGLTSTPEQTAFFFEKLAFFLDQNMSDEPPLVYPGVVSFLERVSQDWSLGLVTGNIRACAYIKIKQGGLASFFGDIGGFGDDDGDRNKMAALALQRAGNPSNTFLLGDTPSDIEAARVNNMISVAVCNGIYDRATLEAEGPDFVLDSFEDAEALFSLLDESLKAGDRS